MKTNQYTGFEIAVVGMSIRTSGASNWREFWENLVLSKESLRFLTEKELIDAGMDKSVIKDKNYVNCTTNLINKDCFDSKFFGYSNDEAKMMYPGHRFFHECVWEALEDAGYIPENINVPVGVYAGAGEDALWQSFVNLSTDGQKVNNFYLNKINNKDYLATMVSYKLGLKGPSMNINTACSTSLVAIHTACKALIFGETKVALAGASSLVTDSQKGYIYEEGSIVSKDGHCKAFDRDSTGTVNGEGTGVVVLKRLKDALADRDNIYAVIKGSAINNDGNKKVGYTAPSVEGQVACIKMAQKFSRIEPETISYVETHGTGTKLGDSIEVEALNIAFNNSKNFPCAIGSVKTNIGHLDTASGVAGFIKTVLSLKNKKIPASLHFSEPDPNINFQDGPFFVNNSLSEWTVKKDNPLRAAVNSFGVGGTNAHIILEEAPVIDKNSFEKNYNLLVLSSKTESSLNNYLDKLANFLAKEENLNLSDMCYTYQAGRQSFENRIALSFKDKNELQQKLEEIVKQKKTFAKVKGLQNTIIFMFPGQGSQYVDMSKDLYLSNSIYREYMDSGFELLKKLTNQDFKKILYPGNNNEGYNINDTCFAQPIIFLVEYSLAKLLINYGIVPKYMIGHSIGEYTAACISGLFTFEQALKLVVKRGGLMHRLPKGSMISVPMNELQAQSFLNEEISLAAINGPEQIVFSGGDHAIQELIEKLTEKDISYIRLHTSHAFHSSMQESILKEFDNEFKSVEFNNIQIPFISNLTGDFIKNEEAISSEYWTNQLRNTVNFSKGISNFLSDNNLVFIEVGAGSSLSSLIRQQKTEKKFTTVDILRSVKIIENDEKYFLEKLGLLWTYGVSIKWQELYKNEDRYRISLPTYAFDKLMYQTEIDVEKLFNIVNQKMLNDLDNSFYFPSWKRSVLNQKSTSDSRIFLVFSDNSDCSKKIIEEILCTNNSVIEVSIGMSYFKHSSTKFSIDPSDIRDYNQLFQDVESEGLNISDIIYLWGLNIKSSEIKLVEENLEFNLIYFCLGRIIKVWGKGVDKNIFVFTNLLHSVLGNENINYVHSLLLGLIKVMPLENQIIGANIDIDLSDVDEKLIRDIVSEFLNNDLQSERIISYRLGQRWVQEFQKGTQDLTKKETSFVKKQGTYLITGGLGNLGFSISKHLINKHQANVILLGRKSLNEINENNLYEKRFKELKSINNNVVYLNVDISNIDEFKEELSVNKAMFDDINGIIHLAGNVDSNDLEFIENTSFKKTISMLAAKVKGVECLYEVFKNHDLDFIWMSSSLAATFGGISFGAYAAANCYLDYFTFCKSGKLKCVQLPKINFEESLVDKQQNILSVDEVIEVFEKSLNIKSSNVIYVSKEDIPLKLNRMFSIQSEALKSKQIFEKIERPVLQSEYQSPQTDIERRLKVIFEDFFEILDIGVTDDFFELGGDSLRAMVILKKINKEFNIEISISDFFSNKNIQGTANLIEEKKWLNNNIELENEITI
ncbi:SDR family NAD(P)-dependent oxidoreductase [Flavobacterium sp. ZT3R18]|uniref:type I polyketide synthase n=1 Tax=Flavobacterium sp. ZT3R18 TaxID=2594429 RepID=UPI001179F496|nr:type I polyketide synthase [Flavobacterium sp. ZT3R18]TRX33013.1 SDR family NAD(P)-dependent oxidoreductase [Flavobacterium sp. ZT3R18]